jgi:adenosine kinase
MDILLTGSVAYDYLMTFPGHFKEQILPERLGFDQPFISCGWHVQTARRHCAKYRLHHGFAWVEKPRVMATVGEDFGDYRAWLEAKGVDTDLMKVVPGVFTASFFATTDHASAQIASFYPGAMGYSATQSLKELDKKPDLVIVSPSSPDAMMKFPAECRELGIPYLYDPSQQVLRLEGGRNLPAIWKARTSFSAMTMNSV